AASSVVAGPPEVHAAPRGSPWRGAAPDHTLDRTPDGRREVRVVHALVLNATYEPLGVVAERRALLLVLARKATSLESTGRVARSAEAVVAVPAVIRLNRFVKVPHRG